MIKARQVCLIALTLASLVVSANIAAAIDGTVPVAGGSVATTSPPPVVTGGVPTAAQGAAALMQLRGQTALPAAGDGHTYRSDPVAVIQSPAVEGGPRAPHALPDDAIWLMTDSSQVFDFPYRLKRVSIADSRVADIEVINPHEINIVGHQTGFTTLTVWDEQGHYQQRQVRIDIGGKQQVMLKCVVAELDRGKLENMGINLSIALQNAGLSLVALPGLVATPFTSQTQVQLLSPGGGLQTLNLGATLPPGGSLIPMLLSPNLTYGLSTSNGQWNTQSFFQILEDHNLATVLAEPNLLANSGEKAQFLSGGEIPIVIAQALNTSIVFKEYGTKVTFVPTVIGRDDIELFVEPEVSEPDYTHAVQLFGFTVPAFITRRAHTMVRLKTGRTLIIAGLNLTERHAVVQKVPYLGDIPYAGALFRNTNYQSVSSDLVMTVTPELVGPIPQGGQVYHPSSAPPMTAEDIKTKPLAVPDVARPRF